MGQRGQKKNYIQKITSKDEKMLQAFRACGYITRDMLMRNLTMSNHRVENFQRDGYIEKIIFMDAKQNKTIHTFRLTPKGKNYLEQNLNLSNSYKSTSISHDLEVAKIYMCCSETERATWKTETDLRNLYNEKLNYMRENHYAEYNRLLEYLQNNEISCIDGSYIRDETGVEMSAEVVTDSYGREEIEAKVTFCHIMNIYQ